MSSPMTAERFAQLDAAKNFAELDDAAEGSHILPELFGELARLRKLEAAVESAAKTIEANRAAAERIASCDPNDAAAYEARVRASAHRWCLTRLVMALGRRS